VNYKYILESSKPNQLRHLTWPTDRGKPLLSVYKAENRFSDSEAEEEADRNEKRKWDGVDRKTGLITSLTRITKFSMSPKKETNVNGSSATKEDSGIGFGDNEEFDKAADEASMTGENEKQTKKQRTGHGTLPSLEPCTSTGRRGGMPPTVQLSSDDEEELGTTFNAGELGDTMGSMLVKLTCFVCPAKPYLYGLKKTHQNPTGNCGRQVRSFKNLKIWLRSFWVLACATAGVPQKLTLRETMRFRAFPLFVRCSFFLKEIQGPYAYSIDTVSLCISRNPA
jgi:hypothetical protein